MCGGFRGGSLFCWGCFVGCRFISDECWQKLGQTHPAVQLTLSVRHVNFNPPPPPPLPLEGEAGFIGPLPQTESERAAAAAVSVAVHLAMAAISDVASMATQQCDQLGRPLNFGMWVNGFHITRDIDIINYLKYRD